MTTSFWDLSKLLTDSLTILTLLHLAVTWYLVGLIWTIQRVHYPSMAFVDPHPERAVQAERQHCDRIFWIVGPTMLIEGALAAALLFVNLWLNGIDPKTWILPALGIVLLLVIWISTAIIQMPLHNQLLKQPNPTAQQRLVNSNWIRTVAWSLRGLVALLIALMH